jgi:cell division protease FtsH
MLIRIVFSWLCGLSAFQAFLHNNGVLLRKTNRNYMKKPREREGIFNDGFHLNDKNLERLEKLFYLKNSRYSPYKNKYQNHSVVNVTEILEHINNDFMRQFDPKYSSEQPSLNNDSDVDSDVDIEAFKRQLDAISNMERSAEDGDDDNSEKYDNKQSEHGFFDHLGVFRYKNPTIFISTGKPGKSSNQRSSGGGNGPGDGEEFGGDGNFQIIKQSSYSFNDVGGYDKIKAELLQTADILLNYEKYRKYNVRTPKGIIFEGPPGNGKTLMAKGFCGELNVSFIPVSGSEFSEKFVGVGASRVRELFKLAEDNKPCIIFIDEIDAVARKRGNDAVSSNSEKDQTLNQLLINLDGFKHSNGIFVIGATNRIDLLDPALMRPGRMDKNIFIGNPDSDTRRSILQIHLEGKPLDSDVFLDSLIEITGGFSGAQIENLLNEAMLRALRENREIISMEDIEYISNRVLAGWQSTESKYSDDIIQRIAIHEMGHAVVGFFSEEHPRLTKICLNLWSPKTPGYTVFESNDENVNIYTKEGLFSHLMVLLGGRIAEELFFGYSVTTGARKDLDEAYKLAQNMIIQYGMGKQNIYPDLSDQSKYLIDQEVNFLLVKANDAALEIMVKSKDFILECSKILRDTHVLKPDHMVELVRTQHLELWKEYNITRFLQ